MRIALAVCILCPALSTAAFAAEAQPPPATAPTAAAAAKPAAAPMAVASADAPSSGADSATAAPPAPVTITKPAPKPPGRYLVYTSFAFNVYTYLGAQGMSPATNITPDNRAIIYQQLGFGYFVHPSVRLTLTFQFGETLTGLAAGASHFTLFAVIPWVVYTTHGFFTGLGPVLAPISYGKVPNFDAGIYTATGYTFKLGRGFSLSPALQAVLMLNQRTSFALTPTVALAYRF